MKRAKIAKFEKGRGRGGVGGGCGRPGDGDEASLKEFLRALRKGCRVKQIEVVDLVDDN